MEDEENLRMLDHLQKYVPHLEKLISQLKDPKKKNKELQLSKLEGLLSMITDRKKKLKLDTLKKCEDVILKILQKVHPTIYKQMEQTEQRSVPYTKFLCKNPPHEINPLVENEELKTARLQAARARLNEFSTPASPSPPRDISIIPPPIVIPTEKLPQKLNPEELRFKSWEHNFEKRLNLNQDVYKTEKPDIYRRAAESLTSNVNKKPVFERLGARVDMSVPPLSEEDLKNLTESDNVSVTDLEHVRDDLKKKLIQEEGKCQMTDLRLKLTRDRQKEHHKSPVFKPRVEKIFKDPDSKFGSLLSSIDDQILEKKEDKRPKSDKDKDREKHRHKSKKRDRSKERHRSKDRKHHEKEKKNEDHKKDKEEKFDVKERKEEKTTSSSSKPKEEENEKPVFKRLADKYNPRPRKNSIESLERPTDVVVKPTVVPPTNKETLLSTVQNSLLRNIDESLLSSVKEALMSSKDTLSRTLTDKHITSIKDTKTDNTQYLTSIKDKYCPVKDILSNQVDKFSTMETKKDNDQYLPHIKDSYYTSKQVNEIWSPTYGMLPQKNLEFPTPSGPSRSGNTYLNTFIVQNNVSPSVPHNQYVSPNNTFQNQIPPKVFHPYDPIPNTNHFEMNQMQSLDYYSHNNQRPTYQNRSYQQKPPYTRDRQHPETRPSDPRQHSDSWNQDSRSDGWNQDQRQHSESWNHDPRLAARRDDSSRPPSFNRDPRIRSREEKEAAQKPSFVPHPPQTKRRSIEEYPTYGQSRYDMMYNQDRIKNDDTFLSPLNSLYSTSVDNQRTGKGYGVQKFRIPKKKVEPEENKVEDYPKNIDDDKFDEEPLELPKEDMEEVKDGAEVEKPTTVDENVRKEVNEEKESEVGKASAAEQTMLTNFFSNFIKNPNNKTILNAILCSMADNTVHKAKYQQILKIMNSDEEEAENDNKKLEQVVKEKPEKDKVNKTVVEDEEEEDEEEAEEELEEEEEEEEEEEKVVVKEKVAPPRVKTKKKSKIAKKIVLRKSSRNKLKAKKAAPIVSVETSDSVVETVGERIKNRKRNIPSSDPPKPRKCTELDRLHNDIKEMFICDGVLTATGKRMCRILKSDSTGEKESTETSKSKDEDSAILDSPKRRARASNPKVLIEKTDFSKLVNLKMDSESDSDTECPIVRRSSKRRTLEFDSTPETSPVKPRSLPKRTPKSKPNYVEPSEDELPKPTEEKEEEEEVLEEKVEKDTTPEKSVEKKSSKKKKRGHNWAIGVINKKVYKKKVNTSAEEEVEAEPDVVKLVVDEEKDEEPQHHDINYYVKSLDKTDCKLCTFKGKFIVQHYRSVHPQSEVLISRISTENAEKAVDESNDSNYNDVEPVDVYEANNRKKKFTYKCRFCQNAYKNEFAETFFDHLTSHTGEYRYHCSMCTFKTSNVKALRSHRYSSHQTHSDPGGPRPPAYPAPPNYLIVFGYICETCHFIQLDKSSLETHIKNYHEGTAKICKINMSTVTSKCAVVELGTKKLEEDHTIEDEKVAKLIEKSEEKVGVIADVQIKKKEEDPTVFKSNTEDNIESLEMEAQKHEKMREIVQSVIPKKKLSFNLLDRIKSRLDSKFTEEEATEGREEETIQQPEVVEEAIATSVLPEAVISPTDNGNVGSEVPVNDFQPITTNALPMTNVKELVTGSLITDSQPPPLIPINEFAITPKVEEIVIQVGPIAARRKLDYVLYMCYMQSCMFSSTNAVEFELHCKTFHHNKQWDGVCSTCNVQTNLNEIEDAYKHLVTVHGNELEIATETKPVVETKLSYLRMRRLSGDILSEQKPLVSQPEETPFKIVDVQTQQDEDESFNFPFQIANVTTLTPEEDQALNATPPTSLQPLISTPLSKLTVISSQSASGTSTSVTTSIPSYNILVPYITPLVPALSPKKSTAPVLVPLSKANIVPIQSPTPPKVSTSKKVVLKDVPLQAHELIASRKTRSATQLLLMEQKLIHLYKCPELSCSFSTDTKRLFEVHLQQHSEFKPGMQISCLYCNFKTNFRLFAVHCDVRHGRCQFCCNYCFYRAINQSYVEMHQERDHPKNKRRILRAPVNSDALASQAHITLPPIKSIVPLYICGVQGCESKFIFPQDFSNHCVTVHGGTAISCYHCTYTPTNGSEAAVHMQMHNVCYYHCRYCLYGGNTLDEVHNHLSLQHFALIPRVLERKFVLDSSNKGSSDYKWDDPKAYDRLNIITTELTKYVTPTALVEVVSYGSNSKAVINVVKTSKQDKNDTITLYKAPPPVHIKPSVTIVDSSKLPKVDAGENAPIVLNNYLTLPSELLTLTRAVRKQVDDGNSSIAVSPKVEEKNETSSKLPNLVIVEPESIINVEDSDTRDSACATSPPKDPLQLDQVSESPSLSAHTDTTPDVLTNSSFTEDESDFTSHSDDSTIKKTSLSGKDLFRCTICQDSCETGQTFKEHLVQCVENHRNGIARPYGCWHCFKVFKAVSKLIDHISVHGPSRFACSLCDYKQSHHLLVKTHMKLRHNVHNVIITPVSSDKQNLDQDEFVLKPKINRQKSSEAVVGKDSSTLTGETVLEFGPEDINSLPLREIYSKEVKCSACGYATKVRANLIRHFQFHKTGKEVSIPAMAPVNPVPCLDKNEKMFDKMFNLSLSSYNDAIRNSTSKTDKKDQPKITKEVKIELPTFVPVTKRYVCGANNCDYLCLEEAMLRSHLQALHSDETSYKCMHCKEVLHKGKGMINVDQIIKHFRLHDLNLYKCNYCMFVHYLKHKVDKHVLDKHPNSPPLVVIIREMEHEPVEFSHAQDDVKETKPWRCSMCKYRCSTKAEIISHALNKHELDTQFKCALCQYRTSTRSNFGSHFQLEHPGRTIDVIDAYYEEEATPALKALDFNPFDTTPIWQREKTKAKYIRGIPIEEVSKLPKRSFPKSEDKNETKKVTHTQAKKPKTLKEKKLELKKEEEDEIIEIEDDDNVLLMIDEKPKVNQKLSVISASPSQSDENKVGDTAYTLEDLMSMDITKLKKANLSCPSGAFGLPRYRQYLCPVCNSFKTKKKEDITNHLYKHHDYHKFVCTICRLTGITYNFLKRHSARKHIGLPEAIYPMTPDPQIEDWVCKVLAVQTRIMEENDNTATVSSTTVHEVDKSPKKTFGVTTEIIAADSSSALNKSKGIQQCQHCSYNCKSGSDLRKHERRHWVQKPLRCGYCDFDGVTNYEIYTHSKRAHPNVEPQVVTVPTPSTPTIKPIARKRKYPKSETAISSSSDEIPAKINVVDSDDSFSKSDDGDAEVRKGVFNYRCGHCSVVGHLDVVKEHFKSAHPDLLFSAFRYQCKHCNKYFKNIDKIRAHYKYLHNDSVETCFDINDQPSIFKEYTCDYCQSDFAQHSDLINHHNMLHSHLKLTTSTDIVPEPTTSKTPIQEKKLYKCSQILCKYYSSTYAAMRDHVRVHAKPFQCGYCTLRFIYPSYVKAHLRKDHPDLDPSYHTSAEGATLYAELRSNIMVLNDNGEYQKIKLRTFKQKPAQPVKNPKPNNVPKQTARKSTTQIVAFRKPTARKSTTYIPPPPPPSPPPIPPVDDPGFTFYGNEPDMTGVENLKTVLMFNNSHLRIGFEQLKKIFDILPTVEVIDLKYNKNEL